MARITFPALPLGTFGKFLSLRRWRVHVGRAAIAAEPHHIHLEAKQGSRVEVDDKRCLTDRRRVEIDILELYSAAGGVRGYGSQDDHRVCRPAARDVNEVVKLKL